MVSVEIAGLPDLYNLLENTLPLRIQRAAIHCATDVTAKMADNAASEHPRADWPYRPEDDMVRPITPSFTGEYVGPYDTDYRWLTRSGRAIAGFKGTVRTTRNQTTGELAAKAIRRGYNYMWVLEFGSSHSRAFPFMRPAAAHGRSIAVGVMVDALKEAMEWS